jgi:nitroreductase
MDVIEAIYHRRSVRAFRTDAVPSEVIDHLVSAAVQAPSAMNLQPWAFLIAEGRTTLWQFSERAKRHLLETMTPDSPFFHYRDRLSEPAFDIFYGASVLVVTAATSDLAQSAEDCCLGAQNLMLAAHGMGLGTCCIGFARPWLNLAETKAELGLPASYSPIIPIVVGYAKSSAPPVRRKSPEIWRVRGKP